MESERLKPILEAALLASPQPLTATQLAELFDEVTRPPADQIGQALLALAEDCGDRGVELVQVGTGFRYQIKAEVFPQISALWTERQTRYSRALLETLSLIAYRQPITRGEIEQIRGVAVATSILRTLEEREWVRVVGHRDVPGKPALYGTSKAFLDYFALKSLDELPPLSALRDLDNLEPELALEVAAPDPDAASQSVADGASIDDTGPATSTIDEDDDALGASEDADAATAPNDETTESDDGDDLITDDGVTTTIDDETALRAGTDETCDTENGHDSDDQRADSSDESVAAATLASEPEQITDAHETHPPEPDDGDECPAIRTNHGH